MEQMKQTMIKSLDINMNTNHGIINHHVLFGLTETYLWKQVCPTNCTHPAPAPFSTFFFSKCPQGIVFPAWVAGEENTIKQACPEPYPLADSGPCA